MVTARQAPASPRTGTTNARSSGVTVVHTRRATASNLDAVNQVVVEAVKSWALPARVHRLATPALTYDATDLAHMSIVLLSDANGSGIGVAAWEEASRHQSPAETRAVLLHGLYVVPHYQRMGVGTRLTGLVLQWSGERGFDGVIVRAWRDALPFFHSIGFEPLADADHFQDPRPLWKPVQPSSHQHSAPSVQSARRTNSAASGYEC